MAERGKVGGTVMGGGSWLQGWPRRTQALSPTPGSLVGGSGWSFWSGSGVSSFEAVEFQ